MKVSISEETGVVIAGVDSSILQENVPLLRTRLTNLVEEGKTWVVIDLSKANYLSSMAVAALVDMKLRTNKNNGDMNLACANHLIRNLLEITNVTRKIDVFDTIDEAVEALVKIRDKS